MNDPRIPKWDVELYADLKDKLSILSDALDSCANGKRYQYKVIAATLRALICDSKNQGGLLTYLIKRCAFDTLIPLQSGQEMTLDEYKDTIIVRSESGGKKVEKNDAKLSVQSQSRRDWPTVLSTERWIT